MSKGKKFGPPWPPREWAGDYICAGDQVVTDRMPNIVFEIDRDEDGWAFRSTSVTEEVDFLIGLDSMGFKYLDGTPIEAPDLLQELDDSFDRLRSRFMELDAAEQARLVSTLWDHAHGWVVER